MAVYSASMSISPGSSWPDPLRAAAFRDAAVTCDGRTLGVVQELVFSPHEGVVGFRLQAPLNQDLSPEETLVVPFDAVSRLCSKEIEVLSPDDVLAAAKLPRILHHLQHPTCLIGMPVHAAGGQHLAFVHDVLLDGESGMTVAYVLGALPNQINGQITLSVPPSYFVALPDRLQVLDEQAHLLADLLKLSPIHR